MAVYPVFKGCCLIYNDFHMKECCSGFKPNAEIFCIDHCMNGRIEWCVIMALPDGYNTVIGEGGGTLSGGEKQRISIARAILKNAPVVILGEATASIDPENEHLLQAAISELAKGKTLITIAHRLATIENAGQILVVNEGRIIQKGTHKELIRQEGKYLDFVRAREQTEGWQIQ